jgi:hypothetical protein
MKKSIVTSFTVLTLGLVLAGCGSSSADKSDNAGKEAKTTETAKGKTKKEDKQHIKNGPLLKVGQWKTDSTWGKTTLEKISAPKSVIKDGPLEITINTISLYKIEPQNDDEKQMANDGFQTSGVTNPYYTVHIDYNVKNTSSETIQLNGLKSVVTSTGQDIGMDSGLVDDGTGLEVAPNANKGTAAEGLLNKGDETKVNKVTIQFDEAVNSDTFESLGSAQPMDFDLK